MSHRLLTPSELSLQYIADDPQSRSIKIQCEDTEIEVTAESKEERANLAADLLVMACQLLSQDRGGMRRLVDHLGDKDISHVVRLVPRVYRELKTRGYVELDPIQIYTDGSCTGTACGAGVVIISEGGKQEISRYVGEGTSNTAEMKAVLMALRAVKDRCRKVQLYTDCLNLVHILSGGSNPKADRDVVDIILVEAECFEDLEVFHVKAHKGDRNNMRADKLAKQAVQRQFKRREKRAERRKRQKLERESLTVGVVISIEGAPYKATAVEKQNRRLQ